MAKQPALYSGSLQLHFPKSIPGKELWVRKTWFLLCSLPPYPHPPLILSGSNLLLVHTSSRLLSPMHQISSAGWCFGVGGKWGGAKVPPIFFPLAFSSTHLCRDGGNTGRTVLASSSPCVCFRDRERLHRVMGCGNLTFLYAPALLHSPGHDLVLNKQKTLFKIPHNEQFQRSSSVSL